MACDLPFGFKEFVKDDAGREEFDLIQGQGNATRIFIGPWESRMDFLAAAVFPTVSDDESHTIVYGPLGKYPDIPTWIATKAINQGIAVPSESGADSQISFEKVKITVIYSTVPFESGGGGSPDEDSPVFLSEEFDTTIEEITFPKTNFIVKERRRIVNPDYVSGDGTIPQYIWEDVPNSPLGSVTEIPAVKILVPITNYKITQHFLTKPRWGVISACLQANLNDRTFVTPSGLRAQRDSILYQGPAGAIEYTFEGSKGWSVTHAFSYKPHGWNRVHTLVHHTTTLPLEDGDSHLFQDYYEVELKSVRLAKTLDGDDLPDASLYDRRNLNALIYAIPFWDFDCGSSDTSHDMYQNHGGYNNCCVNLDSPFRIV